MVGTHSKVSFLANLNDWHVLGDKQSATNSTHQRTLFLTDYLNQEVREIE